MTASGGEPYSLIIYNKIFYPNPVRRNKRTVAETRSCSEVVLKKPLVCG